MEAVTSRKTLTVRDCSPTTLMGSASWIWRLSTLKPCCEGVRNIGGGDRPEHLVVLTGLAREPDGNTIEEFRLLVRGIELGGGLFCQRGANTFKRFHVSKRRFDT